ncbi:MAG: HAD family hydrolase [Vicingus serpentipes]|nr:HAD family hydrolase [Vicingus serpentipes]
MRKVIFLDRDGVINFEPGDYTYQVEKFTIVDGLLEALKTLQSKGCQFIIITNQGGISKGIYNHADVDSVHQYMIKKMNEAGITILDIYYCPHHDVNEKCICRKPDSLMLEKAIARYGVDKSSALFIGDSPRDMDAAQKAGIKGLEIVKNDNLNNYINQIGY